jgi:AraC-like DNA-binding protein
MIIDFDIFTLSNFITIVVCGFLGIHFLVLKNINQKVNVLLAVYLFLTMFTVLTAEFENQGIIALSDFFYNLIATPFQILLVFMLYAEKIMHTKIFKGLNSYKIFMVVMIEMTILILLFLLESMLTELAFGRILLIYSLIVSMVAFVIYFKILGKIKLHNNNILKLFSSIENKQLNWLKLLVMINIGFNTLWILDDTLAFLIPENPISESLAITSHLGTFVSILWIGFASLRQELIFTKVDQTIITDEEEENLEEENLEILKEFNEITQQIIAKELYLNENLTLNELSSALNIKPKRLTLLIKIGFQAKFYHYINALRVEHFKKLIEKPENRNISIEGLSIDSGFKSKSTFYTAFKKMEGLTPGEYELRKRGSNALS